MLSVRPSSPDRREDDVVWPNDGTTSPPNVADVFGPRPFSAHLSTVGYDYDFHRGIDLPMEEGDVFYSPITGAISRAHYTHFNFGHSDQLQRWTEVDPSGFASAHIVPGESGLVIEPVLSTEENSVDKIWRLDSVDKANLFGADFDFQVNFATLANPQEVGIGILDKVNNEYLYTGVPAPGYSGVDASGTFLPTSVGELQQSSENYTWVRIFYDKSEDLLKTQASTDGSTWENVLTKENASQFFTLGDYQGWTPFIYWKGSPGEESPIVGFAGWIDFETIGRFGNWIQVQTANQKFLFMHARELLVGQGEFVTKGQPIARVGKSGFDDRSGRINTTHVHLEYAKDNTYFYNSDDVVNPIEVLPHTYSEDDLMKDNFTIVKSEAEDPDGVDSWLIEITCDRTNDYNEENFALNQINIQVASSGYSIDFNERLGLNPDNDIPKQSGVYLVPHTFNEDSTSYKLDVYLNKNVFGANWTCEIRDVWGYGVGMVESA